MKKILILALMVMIGVSLVTIGFADEARTIPMKMGVAKSANAVIVGHGGTLYRITGYAASANAVYSIHDCATVITPSITNVIAEGGEATQYDSFPTIDFGDEGVDFNTGLTVITSTSNVVVLYR